MTRRTVTRSARDEERERLAETSRRDEECRDEENRDEECRDEERERLAETSRRGREEPLSR